MKKANILVVSLLFHYLLPAQSKVSFDMLSFNEPANWTFTDNGSFHTYTTINNSTSSFCVISVYNSDVSSGNAGDDFRKAWKGILASHFTVSKQPAPQQNNLPGGLTYTQDQSPVSNDKGNFFARLLVFNLKGKAQPVLFLSMNQDMLSKYQADLDHFTATIQQNNAAGNSTVNNTSAFTNNNGTIHFNHFIFTIPDGWKPAQQGAYYSLSAPNVPENESLSFILMPPLTTNSFEEAGTTTINELAAGMNGIAQTAPYVGHPVYQYTHEGTTPKGWQYSMGTGVITISYGNAGNSSYRPSDQYEIGVYLAKIHGRIERVVYLSKHYSCGIYGSSTYINMAYESVINDFFFTLSYDDYDTKVEQGKITSTGISGVWSGVSLVNNLWMNTDGSTTPSMIFDATYYILFDNGQVYYGNEFPRHGLLNLNTTAIAANQNSGWGTYNYQDGSGVMKFSWRNIPFTMSNGKMTAEMNSTKVNFQKLILPEKTTLNGTWCLAGTETCISFTPEGKFIDHGIVSRIEHAPTTCNFFAPEKGEGTYEIKNYTIVFHFNTGLTVQYAFPGLGIDTRNASPAQLAIGRNTDMLQKK